MKYRRVLVIGERKSGKETIADWLNDSVRKYYDNEPIYREKTIQVPSAYLENSWMYRNIITISQDAACVLLVIDMDGEETRYSPGFARIFTRPVYGVVTHCSSEEKKQRAYEELKRIGICHMPLFLDPACAEEKEKLQNWYTEICQENLEVKNESRK